MGREKTARRLANRLDAGTYGKNKRGLMAMSSNLS
jgi:hypothetical protein